MLFCKKKAFVSVIFRKPYYANNKLKNVLCNTISIAKIKISCKTHQATVDNLIMMEVLVLEYLIRKVHRTIF